MSPIGWMLAVTSIFCCFYLISTDARTHTNRHTRQAVPEYNLDVLVVTDYAVWKLWYDTANPGQDVQSRRSETLRNIRQYFTLVIKEVSDLYRSLKTSFRVKFNPVGFYIVESQNQVNTPWTVRGANGFVNASQAFSNFESWLKDQRTFLPLYDHALLFTGENLEKTDGGSLAGLGSVGTICNARIPNYYSVSLVEDNGAFQSVFTTMHELGHGLNSSHDGTNNACSDSDDYVMASGRLHDVTDANRRNVWFFSPCSTAQIDSYVQNILKNSRSAACLRIALTPVEVPDVTGVIPGQLIDADTQCQRLYGPRSAFNFLGNLSNICLLLSCRDPTDDRGLRYWKRLPATGTTCGNGRWCEVGQCVGSPSAPSVPSCYRDQSKTIYHRTCEEMTKVEPIRCYKQDIYQQCCQSCNNLSDTRVPGCPYGDRYGGCRHEHCNRIWSDGRIESYDCCETCNFDMSTWTCMDDSIVDGMTCSKAVEKGGFQQCYNVTLAFYCCATCEKLRDLTRGRGCEYGNSLLNGCRAPAANDIPENCDTENCCDTCRAQVTDSAGCTISLHSFLFFLLVPLLILDFDSIL